MSRLIFVIEDEKDIRDSLTEALESEGYSTICASNGREAIQMFEGGAEVPEKMPDLILLDHLMPFMNGASFLVRAKQNRHLADIPTILMSADRRMTQKAAVFGADGYLHKPLELDDLFGTIEGHRTHKNGKGNQIL